MQSILLYGKSYTNNLNSEKGLRGYKCALKSKVYIDMGKENKFTTVQKKTFKRNIKNMFSSCSS